MGRAEARASVRLRLDMKPRETYTTGVIRPMWEIRRRHSW